MLKSRSRGFTLIELVMVLILVGILGATISTSLIPSDTFQLQSSRDQIVTAFSVAQQRAMAQTLPVRLILSAPNQVDVREDSDGDGDFADESGLNINGIRYPITLLPNQSFSAGIFDFNRLGQTTPATINLTQNGYTLAISVSANGYIN